MDECVGGWIVEYMDGCMDVWMEGCMGVLIDGCMVGRVDDCLAPWLPGARLSSVFDTLADY